MRTITISDQDVAQVNAILRMHSDMQDLNVMRSMELIGRLSQEEDTEDTVEDLEGQVQTFEDDRDNLARIALIFV